MKAFPQTITDKQDRYDNNDSGMDLRDYFATKILQGLMLRYNDSGYTDVQAIYEAYSLADEMIEARK